MFNKIKSINMVESYTMLPTFSCLPQIKTLCSNHCMHNFHTKFVKIFEICKPHSQNLNKTLSPEQCSLLCFELALGRIFLWILLAVIAMSLQYFLAVFDVDTTGQRIVILAEVNSVDAVETLRAWCSVHILNVCRRPRSVWIIVGGAV